MQNGFTAFTKDVKIKFIFVSDEQLKKLQLKV